MEGVEDCLILLVAFLATVDVKLSRRLVLPNDIVVSEPALAGARADPILLTGGDAGMELGLRLGVGQEFRPEVTPQIVALRKFLLRLTDRLGRFARAD